MSNERNHTVDTIKGVLILFVVAGHIPAPEGSIIIPLFQGWLYIFHMPAFFILASLYIKDLRKEVVSTLPLLFCYIFWLTMGLRYNPDKIVHALLFSNWASINGILWFLPALLTFKYIFSIQTESKIARYSSLLFCFLIILYKEQVQKYHTVIPWGIDIALYLIPIAFMSKRYFDTRAEQKYIITYINHKYKMITCSVLIFLVFSMIFYFRVSVNTFTPWHYRLDLAQFSVPGFEGYLYLLVMILSLINISMTNIQKNYLSVIGKKSLPIFIFHMRAFHFIDRYISLRGGVGWVLQISASVLICFTLSIVLLRISKWFRYIGA